MRRAEEVLLDMRLFTVDDAAYQRFVDRLDAPPAANAGLHALLHSKAPWGHSPVKSCAHLNGWPARTACLRSSPQACPEQLP